LKNKFVSIILAVIFFIIATIFCVKFKYPKKYDKIVSFYCEEYNLSKGLVFAIIKTESSFNKNAVSSKGAVGLMQIMPSTANFIAEQINVESFNLKSVVDNIKFGCFYLNYLFLKFHSEKLVVFAYNAGEGNVKKYLSGEKLPAETLNYYKKVHSAKQIYDKIYFFI